MVLRQETLFWNLSAGYTIYVIHIKKKKKKLMDVFQGSDSCCDLRRGIEIIPGKGGQFYLAWNNSSPDSFD